MINKKQAKRFCKDPIEKIENYEAAIADEVQTWHLHHRLELTLDGEFAHSRDELKRLNMYYKRPYFELIFLTPAEHRSIHSLGFSDETKAKISASMTGKNHWMIGKTLSEETKTKIAEAQTGKTHSDETKAKISASTSESVKKLAKEYEVFKAAGGQLKWQVWLRERKLNSKKKWQKYRNEGGGLSFRRWNNLYIKEG